MLDFVVQNLNTPIYFRSLEAGVFEDIMPLMEKFAPEMVTRMGEQYWELTKAADGKNYDFKCAMMHPKNIEMYIPVGPWNPAIHIRQDIRDALGNPKMDTPDSMFSTLMQIKEKYPDVKPFWIGNTTRFDGPAQGGWITWLYQFGFDKYFESGGKFLATYKDPRFLEGVKWLNKLYNNGLIERGDFAMTNEEYVALRDTGNLGVYIDGINEGYQHTKAGGTDQVYVYSPPFETGSFLQQDNIGWAGWHISKSSKNKERAIQFMSYWVSDEGEKLTSWGIEGKQWVWNKDGTNPEYTPEYREMMKNDPDYRIKTGANFLYFWNLDLYDHWMNKGEMALNTEQSEAVKMYMPKKNLKFYFLDIQPTASNDASVVKQKVEDLYQQVFPTWVMAKPEEVDEMFKKFVADSEALGMEKLETVWTEKGLKMKAIYQPFLDKMK